MIYISDIYIYDIYIYDIYMKDYLTQLFEVAIESWLEWISTHDH